MLCKIGEIEVWRILEMNFPFKPPEELFPNDAEEAREAIERLVPHQVCSNTGKLIIPVQGFLVKTPTHVVLVDSCVGNDKTNHGLSEWNMRSSDRFMSALNAAGVTPEDVDYVLCTHLHTDHVGWNTKLENGRWVPTFANAKYILPPADNEYYCNNPNPAYNQSVVPVIEAGQAEFITDCHMLGDFISLIPTPGHTPGHISVLLKNGGVEAVITGDAIHTTAQCQYPHWHFVYDYDGEQAATSRRQLLEDAAEANRKVLGTHFALPSIGRVHANGDSFHWEDD
ncbi:MAG: MBL fold metallo-hydrolase [Pseudomonadota bacterium]